MEGTSVAQQLATIREFPELKEFLQRDTSIVLSVITGLADMPDAVDWPASKLQAAFIVQVAQGLKQRNSSNSVFEKQQIPEEIVIEIIQHTVPIFGSEARDIWVGYFDRLQIIARTSTFFRDIIWRTPALWALATDIDSERFLGVVLRKSLQCPLAIYLQMPFTRDNFSPRNVVDSIFPHMARCRSLSIDWESDTVARSLVEQLAPNLQWASLSLHKHKVSEGPIRLFDGRADQLQHLELRYGELDWDTITFPRLKSLSIFYAWWGKHPTLSNFVHWLTASPDLESIVVQECIFDIETPLPNIQPAYLPRLKTLRIYDEESGLWDTTSHILPLIHAPALSQFNISFDLQREDEPPQVVLDRALNYLIPICVAVFQQSKFAELKAWRLGVILDLAQRPHENSLRFLTEKPEAIVGWLAENMAPIIFSDLVSLRMAAGDRLLKSENLIQRLTDSLPQLRTLTVETTNRSARLLARLGAGEPIANGLRMHLFPKVQELRLLTRNKPRAVYDMLLKRYGERESGGDVMGTPEPLVRLSVNGWEGWPADLRRRIETFVGQGVAMGAKDPSWYHDEDTDDDEPYEEVEDEEEIMGDLGELGRT